MQTMQLWVFNFVFQVMTHSVTDEENTKKMLFRLFQKLKLS